VIPAKGKGKGLATPVGPVVTKPAPAETVAPAAPVTAAHASPVVRTKSKGKGLGTSIPPRVLPASGSQLGSGGTKGAVDLSKPLLQPGQSWSDQLDEDEELGLPGTPSAGPSTAPAGLSKSVWAPVPPVQGRRVKKRDPLVSGAPPPTVPVPGADILARHEQIHAERKQLGIVQLASQKADDALRGYAPPQYQMPAQKRRDVWKRIFGKGNLPDPGLGAFELALESKVWCFERCFGAGGQILKRTLDNAISKKCIIWFEPGPNGSPFTRLVVGLRADGYVTPGLQEALLETWMNIRVWRDSGSLQVMSNGVQAIRKREGSDGIVVRAVKLLASSAPPTTRTNPAPAAVKGSSTRRPAQTPRELGAAAAQYAQTVADAEAEIRRANEERRRLEDDVSGRMGGGNTTRSPAEITQAVTSWLRDARSDLFLRKDVAAIAQNI
jgi:hypothetical protein